MLHVSTLIFLITGLLFAGLGVPLWRRRVRPNAWYGLRVRSTFADERVWYDANEASGRDLSLLGLVVAVGSLGAALVPGILPLEHVVLLLVVTTLGSGVYAWIGITRANRMLDVLRSGEGSDGADV